VGVEQPQPRGKQQATSNEQPKNERPSPNPEELRRRWLPWVEYWYGPEKARDFQGCLKHGMTYECPTGGERHRFGRPCSLTTCPTHGLRKLTRSWMKKFKHLDGPLVLAEWRPTTPYQGDKNDFAGIRKQGEKWRRSKIEGGGHWVRYERKPGGSLGTVMLFWLQEAVHIPGDLKVVAHGAGNRDALEWLKRHHLDEIDCAENHEEMAMIMSAEHRLQPFGPDRTRWKEQPQQHSHESESSEPGATSAPKSKEGDAGSDYRCRNSPSGDGKREVICPIHGTPMRSLGFIGRLHEYTYDARA
jgi:hypothetical protein